MVQNGRSCLVDMGRDEHEGLSSVKIIKCLRCNMNLITHLVAGFAVGFVFFGSPEMAFLVALGALLPDLDREYWFIPRRAYRDTQLHRALFHNVFVIGIAYLANPLIALGVFLHTFLDCFTTVKDRGCEWFFPLTRLVKRGLYDSNGDPQPLDESENVYFYQEDLRGLLEYADIDLRPPKGRVPWRRVYGFALNDQLLDRGFLIGSIIVALVWAFMPGNSHFAPLLSYLTTNYFVWLIGFLSIAVLYIAGELDRKDETPRMPKEVNFIKYPVFAVGIALLFYWIFLFDEAIIANLENIFPQLFPILLAGILISLASLVLIKWQTRAGKTPATV